MTESEQQQPALVENMLLLRREDFDELLDRAAERGAERVLTHLGLENGHAARDIRELRDLLEAWRDARRTAWQTTVKVITTGTLAALPQSGGRTDGLALLDSFLTTRGAHYHRALSSPNTAFEACSRLSPHLAGVPDAWIHEPWRLSTASRTRCGASGYALPLLDVQAAARQARERVWAVHRRADYRREADAIQSRHGSRRAGLPATGKRPRSRRDATADEQLSLGACRIIGAISA